MSTAFIKGGTYSSEDEDEIGRIGKKNDIKQIFFPFKIEFCYFEYKNKLLGKRGKLKIIEFNNF